MVKSRSEIQWKYTERLKQDPVKYEHYLVQARNRKKKNYTSAAQLSRKDKLEKHNIIKYTEYLCRNRNKKKNQQIANDLQLNNETSGYESANTSDAAGARLIVNIPFPNRRNGLKNRMSQALSMKTKELKLIKENYTHLQKNIKTRNDLYKD